MKGLILFLAAFLGYLLLIAEVVSIPAGIGMAAIEGLTAVFGS